MDKHAFYRARMKLKSSVRIVFRTSFQYETLFVFEVQTSKVRVKKANGVEVRLLQPNDLPKLNKLKGPEAEKTEERLQARDLCFIGENGGHIVHYEWICLNEIFQNFFERKIRVSPNSAYVYNGYTVPKYRSRGISAAVLTNAANYLFQNGIEEMYVIIASDNYPSLRTWQKIGPRKLGEVTFIKLFNSRTYKCKAETPRDYAKLRQMLSI